MPGWNCRCNRFLAAGGNKQQEIKVMSVTVRQFGTTKDGKEVKIFTITNEKGMKAEVSELGATLVSLIVPNDKGEAKDVVLGYDDVDSYVKNGNFLGGTIGPNSNRIADHSFELDGVIYTLADNDGGNNLHSDFDIGFHKKLWRGEITGNGVKFSCKKPDMEMGFPGNMDACVTYSISEDNELKLEYEGVSDKATIFNMTNHSYFALGGPDNLKDNLYDTTLWIKSSCYTEIVPGAIPTGKLIEVKGTPMDFNEPKKIGKDIDADYDQMKMVHGYDHNYVIDGYDGKLQKVACASCDGRTMEVYSDLPGIQFYSGNGLADQTGKNGVLYGDRMGFCLETQYFPNCINEPSFISAVKAAGEKYNTVTIYKFV